MPPEKDWRAPPDDGSETLQYCDIAIGYLSRNPRYRRDYAATLAKVRRGSMSADEGTARLIARWGMSFHAAPAAAFDPKLAVARPDLDPASIVLAPAHTGIGAVTLDSRALGPIRARMQIGGLVHLILADDDGDGHVWVSGTLDRPLAMMVPIGDDPSLRFAAAERLSRRLHGIATGPSPLRPSPFRRQHLLTLLQLLDGRQAGASRRELAAALIGGDVRDYNAAEWVDSRERKRIGRWIAEAVELRDGGYIRLLRGD